MPAFLILAISDDRQDPRVNVFDGRVGRTSGA